MRTAFGSVLLVAALLAASPGAVHGLSGDVDGSGRVDGLDLAIVSRLLGASRGDARFVERADVDGDGRITEADLAVIRANFARTGRDESVWVADTNGNRLVQLSRAGGRRIRTVEGVPAPSRVAVDTSRGDAWALARGGLALVHVSPAGGRIATLGGFGSAVELVVDGTDGTCWVADSSPLRVYAIQATAPDGYDVGTGSGSHRTVRGFDSFFDAAFVSRTGRFLPGCLAVDGARGALWVAYGGLVRLSTDVSATYDLTFNSGSHVKQLTARASIVAVNPVEGTCFAARFEDSVVSEFEPSGSAPPTLPATVSGISLMAVNSLDGTLWVATGRSPSATELIRLDSERLATFRTPIASAASISVDSATGDVWAANARRGTIERYSAGAIRTLEVAGFGAPGGVAVLAGEAVASAPVPRVRIDPQRAAVGQRISFFGSLIPPQPGARFEWDFDGDGTFDFSSTSTGDTTRAYQSAGLFAPLLKVTVPSGVSGIDHSAIVRVGSLGLTVSVDRAQGTAPLAVRLTASISNPQAASIASLQWDFDGDGTIDAFQVPGDPTAAIDHTYPVAGTFRTLARLTDADQHSVSSTLEVRVSPGRPTVALRVAGNRNSSPADLTLIADATPGDAPILGYRWDRENDGIIDRVTSDLNQVGFTYTERSFVARVVVFDSNGSETTATQSVDIFGNAPPGGVLLATPAEGNAPLTVDFSGRAADADGRVVRYDYRFENPNGPVDSSSTTTLAARHAFNTSGTYDVALTLIDDRFGKPCFFCPEVGTATLRRRVVVRPPGSPAAVVSASPRRGTAPLTTTLSAAGSSAGATRYRWFFDKGLLYDDFETGAPGWTGTAPWRIDSIKTSSGSKSWTVTPELGATTGEARLLSPPFDIPPAPARSQLTFFTRFENPFLSTVDVRITTDGGATFLPMGTFFSGDSDSTPGLRAAAFPLDPFGGVRAARIAFAAARPVRASWYIDDVRVVSDRQTSGSPDVDSPSAVQTPATYTIEGSYRPLLRVTDSQGRSADATIRVDVTSAHPSSFGAPQVSVSANLIGALIECDGGCEPRYPAPVKAQFTAVAQATSASIESFEWDFDGDGVTDALFKDTNRAEFFYDRPGNHSYRVRVTDSLGRVGTAVGSFSLESSLLRTRVEADRVDGRVPLQVTFVPSVESTSPLTSFQWDFGDNGPASHFSGTGTPVTTTYRYLTPGSYQVCLTVRDAFGASNLSFGLGACASVTVNSGEFPSLALVASPASGQPPLTVTFTPTVSPGSDANRMPSRFDYDFDGDGVVDRSVGDTTPQTFVYAHGATPVVRVTGRNDSGLAVAAETRLSIGKAPVSLVSAFPTSGPPPLDVIFTPSGRAPDDTIVSYDFDFKGAGLFGTTATRHTETLYGLGRTTVPKPIHFVYNEPGVYDARMRVTANNGLTDISTVRITVSAGQAQAFLVATPASGLAPLSTRLTAGLTTGRLVRGYEFDRDGDGAFEITTSQASIEARYPTTGSFRPRVRVTAADGSTATAETLVRGLRDDEPVAMASVSPRAGNAALAVQLDGRPGPDSGPIALHEWDFEGDGHFDYASPVTGRTAFTYAEPGIYTPTYRVTDVSGHTDTARALVEARVALSSSRSPEVLDAAAGQSVSIHTNLGTAATVTVRIVDSARAPVRTLADAVSRPPGVYADLWNGRSGSGAVVDPGIYYYLVDVAARGSRFTQDLTLSPPPAIRRITPQYESQFDPLAGSYLTARYNLPRLAEVTTYIIPFVGPVLSAGSQQIARTLLYREPQPSGDHIVSWDGVLDDGSVAPSQLRNGQETGYLISVFGSELPDNAIIVSGKLAITDLSKEPELLTPGNPYGNAQGETVRYVLSRAATVTSEVQTSEGVLVRTFSARSQAAGPNSLVWDGLDESGSPVQEGIYRVVIEAKESATQPAVRQGTVIEVLY
ncbi:MAG: PKD domain-containing protein [Candidatus Wallbacteria bacterium]|nr:PKD domain-containing protein [Candidatus Wallbacteria bacterium]